MSDKTKNYTAADIHRFTDKDGIERVHIPWGMITGDIPDGVVYPTGVEASSFGCLYDSKRYDSHENTYPERRARPFALIPADRIEIVTEHVEATVMDVRQALVESGGNPVEGWKFSDGGSINFDALCGVGVLYDYKFKSRDSIWKHAYRPVTRVRIKPEAKPLNTREVPEGVAPLPEDKPWLAYVGKGDGEDSGGRKPWCYTNTGYSIYSDWDNALSRGYHPLINEDWHYAIDVRHPEAQGRFPEVCKAHPYVEPKPEPKFKVGDLVETATTMHWRGIIAEIKTSSSEVYYTINDTTGEERWLHESNLRPWAPGYGYTLDGNPVPPPPEGWEIVPEGEQIGEDAKFYHVGTGEWFRSEMHGKHEANALNEIRAYARRVVRDSLTAAAAATADACYPVNLKSLFDVVDAILSIENDANQIPKFLWIKIEAFKKEVRGE